MCPPSPTRSRPGLTLVEVMCALVLVAVGLLGIAGSSALLLRASVAEDAHRRAIRQGAMRAARLAAPGCGSPAESSMVDRPSGLREHWRVDAAEQGMATFDDTLEWTSEGRTHRLVVRGAFLC